MYAARRTEKGFKYVRGKKDGIRDLYINAAGRAKERV